MHARNKPLCVSYNQTVEIALDHLIKLISWCLFSSFQLQYEITDATSREIIVHWLTITGMRTLKKNVARGTAE
jgi:hypothetical protein